MVLILRPESRLRSRKMEIVRKFAQFL